MDSTGGDEDHPHPNNKVRIIKRMDSTGGDEDHPRHFGGDAQRCARDDAVAVDLSKSESFSNHSANN